MAHQLQAILTTPAPIYVPQRLQALRPHKTLRPGRSVGCRRGLGRSWLRDQLAHSQALDLQLVDGRSINPSGRDRNAPDRQATDGQRPDRQCADASFHQSPPIDGRTSQNEAPRNRHHRQDSDLSKDKQVRAGPLLPPDAGASRSRWEDAPGIESVNTPREPLCQAAALLS